MYLYVIQLYSNFEESSLINIVETYNHCLAGMPQIKSYTRPYPNYFWVEKCTI